MMNMDSTNNFFSISKINLFDDVYLIEYSKNIDLRGDIFTTYSDDLTKQIDPIIKFNHDKFSTSKKNVLRGIHGDFFTYKLITCLSGKIFQVIVDLRKDSKTYKKSQNIILNKEDGLSILIPPGFGNAYYALSDDVIYHYKLSYEGKYRDVNDQFSIKWDDPSLKIKWPCKNPILSKRDSSSSYI